MIAERRIATSDLDEILEHAADDIRHFAGQRILITGGTGFVGKWLVSSIEHANRRLGTHIVPHATGSLEYNGYDWDAAIWGAPTLPPNMWPERPLLYLSSGAVNYPNHRPDIAAEKRAGEAICATHPNAKIARMYSFIGPYLKPGYAASDFIFGALNERSIWVKGNPASVRSWMYPTEMVEWLWAIFARANEPVDVGSPEVHQIGDLADIISEQAGIVAGQGVSVWPLSSYTPYDPPRELHLACTVKLEEAVRRTLAFYAP